jgi:hypothetical protein
MANFVLSSKSAIRAALRARSRSSGGRALALMMAAL